MNRPNESVNVPAGLSDIQKRDLSIIWNIHSTVILTNDGTNGNKGDVDTSSSSNGNCGIPSVPMDNQSFNWIASLTGYFIHVVNYVADETIERCCNQTLMNEEEDEEDHNNKDANGDMNDGFDNDKEMQQERNCFEQYSTTLYALSTFFPKINEGNITIDGHVNGNANINSMIQTRQKLKSLLTIPMIPRGRQIVTLDHASFLNELQSYKNDLRAFGAFLYHRPHFALCALNSAIALTIITLNRRIIPMTLISEQQQQHQQQYLDHNNNNNNNNSTPQAVMIHTIFHNVYPTIPIQHVKTSNAYKFITLKGRIIKVHSKRLRLNSADVLCVKCGQHFKHLFHGGRFELPTKCRAVQSSTSKNKCRGQKFEIVRRTAKYIDCQKLKLQEEDNHSSSIRSNNHQSTSKNPVSSSGNTANSAGRSPRSIDLEVTHDLVDTCQAGDCVKVVGVVNALNTAVASGKAGRKAVSETSTYTLYMVANSIVNTTADLHSTPNRNKKLTKTSSSRGGLMFTKDQLEKITRVAHADHLYGPMSVRMAFPFDLLVRSLCPSIIGHECVKAGILLSLLGGTPPSSSGLEDVKCGLSIRSNIHCLIVGDPGMGKSCLLLATQQVAARSVYVGGNTSSTTGLTVSLTKEAAGEIGIEAGALPLADQGVCCIDEFDKMAKNNQDGLLEAMEQQRISIAKAGAICSLPSRCAVIAAANPKHGKYNLNKTVAENLNISSPLLSRFDLVFILRDDVDVDQDKLISGNIMNQYQQENRQSQKRKRNMQTSAILLTNDENEISIKERLPWVSQTQKPLPADLLKDYISYAREYCKPKLTQEAATVLKNYFLTLRYPGNGTSRNDSVPITTRQLEALIRLSQARAKACLRDFVLKEDSEDVVALMAHSNEQVHVDSDGRVDRTRGGVGGKSKRKQKKAFVDALRQHSGNQHIGFSKEDFYRVAAHLDLPLHDFWTLVEELRFCEQPEIRKGSDGMYYLL